MYWAVQNGVFSDDSYQYPLSTVLRKDAVRYLWRFGTNVDGLISGVDDLASPMTSRRFWEKTIWPLPSNIIICW